MGKKKSLSVKMLTLAEVIDDLVENGLDYTVKYTVDEDIRYPFGCQYGSYSEEDLEAAMNDEEMKDEVDGYIWGEDIKDALKEFKDDYVLECDEWDMNKVMEDEFYEWFFYYCCDITALAEDAEGDIVVVVKGGGGAVYEFTY